MLKFVDQKIDRGETYDTFASQHPLSSITKRQMG